MTLDDARNGDRDRGSGDRGADGSVATRPSGSVVADDVGLASALRGPHDWFDEGVAVLLLMAGLALVAFEEPLAWGLGALCLLAGTAGMAACRAA